MKKLITILALAFAVALAVQLPSWNSAEAQVGWGRSSVRSWFFGQCAQTDNCKHVWGFLPAATASTEADIWGGGGELNFPAAAGVISVISTSANDDGAPVGTGARTIVISGLDGDYEEISETVTLNGTTAVNTTATFLRVNLVTVATVGALEENEGAITGGIGGDEIFRILAGRNATNRAVYTVPDGCAGYILRSYATADEQTTMTYAGAATSYTSGTVTYEVETGTTTVAHGSIEVYLARRSEDGVKSERGAVILAGGESFEHNTGDMPIKVSERTDIYFHVYSNGITLVSGGFTLWQICDVAGWQ